MSGRTNVTVTSAVGPEDQLPARVKNESTVSHEEILRRKNAVANVTRTLRELSQRALLSTSRTTICNGVGSSVCRPNVFVTRFGASKNTRMAAVKLSTTAAAVTIVVNGQRVSSEWTDASQHCAGGKLLTLAPWEVYICKSEELSNRPKEDHLQ